MTNTSHTDTPIQPRRYKTAATSPLEAFCIRYGVHITNQSTCHASTHKHSHMSHKNILNTCYAQHRYATSPSRQSKCPPIPGASTSMLPPRLLACCSPSRSGWEPAGRSASVFCSVCHVFWVQGMSGSQPKHWHIVRAPSIIDMKSIWAHSQVGGCVFVFAVFILCVLRSSSWNVEMYWQLLYLDFEAFDSDPNV